LSTTTESQLYQLRAVSVLFLPAQATHENLPAFEVAHAQSGPATVMTSVPCRALTHQQVCADQPSGSLPWWAAVATQLREWMVLHQVDIDHAVVLVPSHKLIPLLQQAWRRLGGPLPRVATLPGLAAAFHALHEINPGPFASGQLTMNLASDELLARQMLLSLAWGRDLAQRDLRGLEQAARAVALTAQELACAAGACAPGIRNAFWQQARAVLKSAGAGQIEHTLACVAAEWAAQAPAPLTDILFDQHPSGWVVLSEVTELDPLTSAVIHHALPQTPCAVFHTLQAHEWAQALPSGEATLTLCEDFEDEAQCVAACVLHHQQLGVQPLALIAQDRLLIRRVSALLQRQGVDLCDEAGWKLSTTRAAAVLHLLLRACEIDACSDDWLQWLADCPACAPGGLFEQAWMQLDRACRQAGVSDLAAMRKAAHTWAEPVQALLRWAQEAVALLYSAHPLPVQGWLRALQASLVHLGIWNAWQADAAGQQLCHALFGSASPPGEQVNLGSGLGVDLGDGDELGGPHLSVFKDAPWSWAEFVAWVERVLESQHFVPPSADLSVSKPALAPVVITTLAQAVLRPFAAVIFPGADACSLSGPPLQRPLLSQAQAQALGLPSPQRQRDAQQQRLNHLLSTPVLRFFRRLQDGKDPVAESPLLEALALRMARAGRVLHDVQRHMDFRVQSVHKLTPAQPGWPAAADLLPSKLSAQAAEALRACPYRFFVQYVLQLREDDSLSGVVQKRDYGDALHQVLMRFHVQRQKGCSAEAETNALHQMAMDIRTEMNLNEAQWLPFAATLARLVPRYVAWLHERDAQNAVWRHGEHEIRIEPDQLGGMALFGRIDRLDELPIAGERAQSLALQVIDYKTGSAEPLKQRLKDPQEDTQLAFYAALVAHDQNGSPVQAAYLLLDTPGAPELLEHRHVQNTAQYLIQGLSQDLQRLRAGHGMPPLGEGADCQFCAARGVCRRDDWA
jgi:ATP-dependent helicase/nuclease subunit B